MYDADLRILLFEVTQQCNAGCDHCGSRCSAGNSKPEGSPDFWKNRDSNESHDFRGNRNLNTGRDLGANHILNGSHDLRRKRESGNGNITEDTLIRADEILDVLRDVKENFGTDVMINITGGEPLMRKDLFDIMSEADSMGFDWGLVTNGTLITDDIIRKMRETHMKTITVSIDGLRETHESLRKLPGSFDRIFEAIRKLKEADFLDHLQVTFTANKRNVYEFPELYHKLCGLGIDSVRISCMDDIGRAMEHRDLLLGKDELLFLTSFINEANEACRAHNIRRARNAQIDRDAQISQIERDAQIAQIDRDAQISRIDRDAQIAQINSNAQISQIDSNAQITQIERDSSVPAVPIPIVWGCPHYLADKLKGREFLCFAGIYAASILYNGDIFVCPNVPRYPELIQGNIRRDVFSSVWKRGFRIFREKKEHEYCLDCKYRCECHEDSLHTWDFEEDRPKFCYKRIFDEENNEYAAYLKAKYGSFELISVPAGDGVAPDIYIEPEAYDEISAYFHIGKRHPSSMYEQQMGLIGFRIDQDYVIKYVFPSWTERLAPDLQSFTEETMEQARKELNIVRRNFRKSSDRGDYIGRGLRFFGFIHSHPAQEELVYSIGDELIHQNLRERLGEYIGILLNPSLDLIGAYYGNKDSGTEIRQGNLKIIRLLPEPARIDAPD